MVGFGGAAGAVFFGGQDFERSACEFGAAGGEAGCDVVWQGYGHVHCGTVARVGCFWWAEAHPTGHPDRPPYHPPWPPIGLGFGLCGVSLGLRRFLVLFFKKELLPCLSLALLGDGFRFAHPSYGWLGWAGFGCFLG